MAPMPFLAGAVMWWSSLYADHQAVSVTVRFLHLAGLLVGGGTALTIDRHLLGADHRDADGRLSALAFAASAHRIVVPSLALMALTGMLMAAADLETFRASRLFWIKMGIVGLLLSNGALLMLAERAAAGRTAGRPWTLLRMLSGASLVLWLSALLAGTWLTVAA
jgi:hypothetical protein